MDCVAIALQAPKEAEGEDADSEADEGHHNPDSSDDSQKQLVPDVVTLGGIEDNLRNMFVSGEKLICFSFSPVGDV